MCEIQILSFYVYYKCSSALRKLMKYIEMSIIEYNDERENNRFSNNERTDYSALIAATG